jgi:sulfatase modifying factor 1
MGRVMDAKKEIKTLKDGAEMVLVPEGKFIKGIDRKTLERVYEFEGYREQLFEREMPMKEIKLKSYYIDKYPVTNGQYMKFIRETNHRTPAFWDDPLWNQPNYPVVGVGWDDAREYAEWALKRLPTEEEWEKAARGTDARWWPWGNEFHRKYCNSAELNLSRTSEVGRYYLGVSPYGAHDMAGNVWEICEGYWWGRGRVMKGGCFISRATFCRVTVRWSPGDEDLGATWLGFRCVKDL